MVFDDATNEDLARAYCEHGDMRARDLLLERLKPLIGALARIAAAGHWELLDDLQQEARVIVIEKLCRFDVSRGYKVTTYMAPVVRHHLRHMAPRLRDNSLERQWWKQWYGDSTDEALRRVMQADAATNGELLQWLSPSSSASLDSSVSSGGDADAAPELRLRVADRLKARLTNQEDPAALDHAFAVLGTRPTSPHQIISGSQPLDEGDSDSPSVLDMQLPEDRTETSPEERLEEHGRKQARLKRMLVAWDLGVINDEEFHALRETADGANPKDAVLRFVFGRPGGDEKAAEKATKRVTSLDVRVDFAEFACGGDALSMDSAKLRRATEPDVLRERVEALVGEAARGIALDAATRLKAMFGPGISSGDRRALVKATTSWGLDGDVVAAMAAVTRHARFASPAVADAIHKLVQGAAPARELLLGARNLLTGTASFNFARQSVGVVCALVDGALSDGDDDDVAAVWAAAEQSAAEKAGTKTMSLVSPHLQDDAVQLVMTLGAWAAFHSQEDVAAGFNALENSTIEQLTAILQCSNDGTSTPAQYSEQSRAQSLRELWDMVAEAGPISASFRVWSEGTKLDRCVVASLGLEELSR